MADIEFMSSRILYCIRHNRHTTREAGQECGLAIEDDLARRRNTRQEAEQSSHGAARAAVGAIFEPVRLYWEALIQWEKNKQEEFQAAETNAPTALKAVENAAIDDLVQVYCENLHKRRAEFSSNEDFEKLREEEAELKESLLRSIKAVSNAHRKTTRPEQQDKAKEASRRSTPLCDAPPSRIRPLEHVPDAHDVQLFAQLVGPRKADRPAPRVAQPWMQPSNY